MKMLLIAIWNSYAIGEYMLDDEEALRIHNYLMGCNLPEGMWGHIEEEEEYDLFDMNGY